MSKKYNIVKKYYDEGFWTKEMVMNAIDKRWITQDEYESIVNNN